MQSKPQKPLIGLANCIAFCLALCLALAGCREHPQVTSRQSLDLIKQLYTACNTRNSERLTKCQQQLQSLVAENLISPAEQQAFESILKRAHAGDWEYAQTASLQFARDQTR